jgi:hypothetical protein
MVAGAGFLIAKSARSTADHSLSPPLGIRTGILVGFPSSTIVGDWREHQGNPG